MHGEGRVVRTRSLSQETEGRRRNPLGQVKVPTRRRVTTVQEVGVQVRRSTVKCLDDENDPGDVSLVVRRRVRSLGSSTATGVRGRVVNDLERVN